MIVAEYKTVHHTMANILDKMVMKHLEEGWKLYGDPYSINNSYCQAMVKYESGEAVR